MSKVVSEGTGSGARRRRVTGLLVVAVAAAAGLVPLVGAEAGGHGRGHGDGRDVDKLLFFASDGLRQDRGREVRRPGRRARLPRPAAPRREGVRQRPADPGAAQHRRRLVHARHRRVARRPRLDQQHVPHQRPAVRATARRRSAAGVLQAETLAQAAERGGKKVAQIEWAGGRSGAIDGPDARLPQLPLRPRRGDELHRADRLRGLHRGVRPAVRPPGRASPARRRSRRPRRRPRPAGPTCRTSLQPGEGDAPARARRRRSVDKYGLNAYIYDSRNDGRTRYDRVLFSPTKDGDDAVGDLREGEWADVKVTILGGDLDGKTGAMLVKVERLAADLSQVRLFHTSVTRAIATLADLAGRARLHRHVRGLRRRALPVLAGGRLRGPRGRDRERGDLRRAGRCTGRPPTTR